MNAIINETVKNKEAEPLSLQVMDVHQMFDSLRMDKTILNLFKNGFDSSELLVIRNANMEVIMAVKNCDDISEESKNYNVILQGDTLAPLISTIEMDQVARDWIKNGEEERSVYKYRGKINISSLGMIDDSITISKAGFQSTKINSFMNTMGAKNGLY